MWWYSSASTAIPVSCKEFFGYWRSPWSKGRPVLIVLGKAPAVVMGQLQPAPIILQTKVCVDPWNLIKPGKGVRIWHVLPLPASPYSPVHSFSHTHHCPVPPIPALFNPLPVPSNPLCLFAPMGSRGSISTWELPGIHATILNPCHTSLKVLVMLAGMDELSVFSSLQFGLPA